MPQKLKPQSQILSGSPQPNFIGFKPSPVLATRDPTTADTGFPLGQDWVNKSTGNCFILGKVSAGSATWNETGAGENILKQLNGDTGSAVPSSSDAITIAGTALEIETSATASTLTIGIPSTFSIGSTSGAAGGTISVGTGNFSLATAPTSTITIGSTTQTGTIVLGQSTAGQTVTLLGGTNTGAQVVNIASGACAADATVNILSGNATAGTQTCNIMTGNRVGSINIGTGAAAHVIGIGSSVGGDITLESASAINLTCNSVVQSLSSASADVALEVTNSDNTMGDSRAGVEIATGGTSSGDPYLQWQLSGGQIFTMGIDNSTLNDDFVFSKNASLGVANVFSIDGSSGALTTSAGITASSGDITATLGSFIIQDSAQGVTFGSTCQILSGTGDPNGAVTAAQGSIFLRVDGSSTSTRLYVNTNGTTGWTNFVSAA